MKFQESYVGSKSDFGAFIKKAVPDLFSGGLTVEGQTVEIPKDSDLDYKVKYDNDDESGSFTVKVSWEKLTDEDSEDDTNE